MGKLHKVILYYSRTQLPHPNYCLDPDEQLEVCDENGNISHICAKDAKKTRACFPLDVNKIMQNQTNFDEDLVKKGYAWTMNKDENKGRQIKVPKNEQELRALFNVTDPKKASYWTHDYDQIDLDSLVSDSQKKSFLRGVFSAKARIKPGSTGYIVLVWEPLNKLHTSHDIDKFIDLVCNFGATMEYNGSAIFFQSRDDIFKFINEIGFIQKSKVEAAITLYRMHIRSVTNVIEIWEEKDLMLSYVQYMGDQKDYPDSLANTYDINVVDKKTGRTPLLNVLLDDKHRSCYPIVWLLKHGADTTIIPKKKTETLEILLDKFLEGENQNYSYFEQLLEQLDIIYVDKQAYTKKLLWAVLRNWRYGGVGMELIDLFEKKGGSIDTNIILSELLDNMNINLRRYCTISSNSFQKLVKVSTEKLDIIMGRVLNLCITIINKLIDDVANNGYYNNHSNLFDGQYVKSPDLGNAIMMFNILKTHVTPPENLVQKVNCLIAEHKISYYSDNTYNYSTEQLNAN